MRRRNIELGRNHNLYNLKVQQGVGLLQKCQDDSLRYFVVVVVVLTLVVVVGGGRRRS